MGSRKEHKHKKDHKHHHKKRQRRSSSDERSRSKSPVEKRRRKNDDDYRKDHKSSKNYKADKRRPNHDERSPKAEERSQKKPVQEVSVVEEEVYLPQDVEVKLEKDNPPLECAPSRGGGGGDESLSIAETNKLREKLGLKPLKIGSAPSADGEESKLDFVHAPAEDLVKKKKEAALREKLQARKDKRALEKKIAKIKTLGDEDEEESAINWVQKSRKKEQTIKKEKEMSALDAEFGIGDLVEKELGSKVKQERGYTEKDLKGLNVEHSVESFKEGRQAILVIKDKEILASDEEDVLHSVNIQDVEQAKKNLDIKRRGVGYKAYEEEEVDEMGFFKAKAVLGKYDEEIEGEKINRFTIGDRGKVDTSWEQQKEFLKQEIRAKGESLALPALKLASEYLTEEEMKFKKRKRKVKKVRKRDTFKADDLLPIAGSVGQDHGSRAKPLPGNVPGWDEGLEVTKITNSEEMEIEENNVIGDEDDAVNELQRALEKSRRAKMKQTNPAEDGGAMNVAERIQTIDKMDLEKPGEKFSTTISLNATDEFCRQLGSLIPAKQEDDEEIPVVEMEIEDAQEEEEEASQWNSVTPGEEKTENLGNVETEDHAPIEAEPLAGTGLMGALQLAKRKGYLEQEMKKGSMTVITNENSHLHAKNYSIEDKNAVDYLDKYAHEKYTKDRGRHDRGMVTDFVEKKDYKPKIAIEYVDDRGRALSEKEAFRKLSHRFHGKGSGKLKTEKRMKKLTEEDTMKHMSSTDTPLNTVAMMKAKLQTEASPYIVLSGAGKTLMGGGSSVAKK
ncbi:U4/U6.U5 tri-snRNP-associated protein 1-like [Clavelina lepadiformis]|uniref:U4/U6.U5 tri-snRNP-associated protein 1 n=1 Tax=Clavelina lepadiformis TaxID=159417 RepID=A0ABP0GWF4_CLALP